MDEGQIEVKGEVVDPYEEFQIKDEPSDQFPSLTSTENLDMPHEGAYIKSEPIGQEYVLSLPENTTFTNSSIFQIKEEMSETSDKSETIDEPEGSGVFNKSGTDIKTKNIFNLSESNSCSESMTIPKDQSTYHDSRSLKSFKCPICLKVFSIKWQKRHLATIHRLKCQFCPVKFVKPKDKLEHVSIAHPNELQKSSQTNLGHEYVYECQFCPKILELVFENEMDLKKHISLAHSYKCQFCTAKFQKKDDMNQHEKNMHSLQCRFCPKRFAKKEDIDYHVNFVHTSKCRFCPSKFVTKDDMNEHILLVHSHNCKFCAAKFQNKEDLSGHEVSMHKFRCQFCPKAFAKRKHMEDHAIFIHQNTSC